MRSGSATRCVFGAIHTAPGGLIHGSKKTVASQVKEAHAGAERHVNGAHAPIVASRPARQPSELETAVGQQNKRGAQKSDC